jgi:hypothetical protein
MPTSPLHVFIDTSEYEDLNYDWHGNLLGRLAAHAADGRVVLHTTVTTRREVERRLTKLADEATQKLLELRKPLLKLGGNPPTTAVPDAQVLISKFGEFLAEINASDHDASTVNCNELISRFFDARPPFSKDKPNEFRDAIAAISLRAWATDEGEVVLVVTRDDDWKAMAEEFPEFEVVRLGKVLERLEAMRVEHLDRFKQRIDAGLETFKKAVATAIEELPPMLKDRWEDEAEASDLTVDSTEIVEVDVLEADPTSGTASIILYCRISVSVSAAYGDDDASHYDSEEHDLHFFDTIERQLERTLDVVAELELQYDDENERFDVEHVGTNLGEYFEIDLDDDWGNPDGGWEH